MPRIHKLIHFIISATLTTLLTTSCTGENKKSEQIPPWDISFRWSADPDVDLDSTEMKIVRATIESNTIAMFLDASYGYPGWRDAKSDNIDLDAFAQHPMTEGIGTAYLHVIPFQTRGGKINVICKDMSGTTKKVDGKYPLPDRNDPRETLEAVAVTVAGSFHADPARAEAVKTPQGPKIPGPEGRHPRPHQDVFSQYSFAFYPHGGLQYRELCMPWAQSRWGGPQPPKPNRTENEPPKIEPFAPGWAE